jgi:spore coat protein H
MNRFLLLLLFLCPRVAVAQTAPLFDDTRVGSIYLDLPADSFEYLLDHVVDDRYFRARFIFDDGTTRDTLADVGLRLRGNTSLSAQKKSFKISFNEFVGGRKFQGVRKLNLRGQHNDPTVVREKLFYDVWKRAGMPGRHTAFVRVYVNGAYRGVYTNVEEIDKLWLKRTYGDNGGNLYKCTWPANLAYLGADPAAYKALMNNPETRAYDLSTNEGADDYARLVQLITVLNQPVNAGYADALGALLDVDDVLKAFAIDVATGNWDDYFYNKNNYYLYDNPATGRFEFVTFDTDNTFGVDWLGKDWAKRNCLAWQHSGDPRPLATRLLAVPAFHDRFVRYLDTLARFIIEPDSIFPRIDTLHARVTAAAEADVFRTLDYGYTVEDFHNGFTETIDGHTPYGIKPFLQLRRDSILSQIAAQLTGVAEPEEAGLRVYPNPAGDWLYVQTSSGDWTGRWQVTVTDTTGRVVRSSTVSPSAGTLPFSVGDLPAGAYVLRIEAGGRTTARPFNKR